MHRRRMPEIRHPKMPRYKSARLTSVSCAVSTSVSTARDARPSRNGRPIMCPRRQGCAARFVGGCGFPASVLQEFACSGTMHCTWQRNRQEINGLRNLACGYCRYANFLHRDVALLKQCQDARVRCKPRQATAALLIRHYFFLMQSSHVYLSIP
jgi:hypothetical protein